MGVPGASEAVSGCNILILPIYASVLRAQEAARRWLKTLSFRHAGRLRGTPFNLIEGEES
jgi:hypothetical protein